MRLPDLLDVEFKRLLPGARSCVARHPPGRANRGVRRTGLGLAATALLCGGLPCSGVRAESPPAEHTFRGTVVLVPENTRDRLKAHFPSQSFAVGQSITGTYVLPDEATPFFAGPLPLQSSEPPFPVISLPEGSDPQRTSVDGAIYALSGRVAVAVAEGPSIEFRGGARIIDDLPAEGSLVPLYELLVSLEEPASADVDTFQIGNVTSTASSPGPAAIGFVLLVSDSDRISDVSYFPTSPDTWRKALFVIAEGTLPIPPQAAVPVPPVEKILLVADLRCEDIDADGLCDAWERTGIWIDSVFGRTAAACPAEEASQAPEDCVLLKDEAEVGRRDLLVEVDSLSSTPPLTQALQHVRRRFEDKGIVVTFDTSGVGSVNGPVSLCDVRDFGTDRDRAARALAYRSLVFVDFIAGDDDNRRPGQTTGCKPETGVLIGRSIIARAPLEEGADALGGLVAAEAEKIMHELGHNLGLCHGGLDEENCKPNHFSIMNYLFETLGVDRSRPINYSEGEFGDFPLDEGALSEPSGLGASSVTGRCTAFGAPEGVRIPDGRTLPEGASILLPIPSSSTACGSSTDLGRVVVTPQGAVDWDLDGDTTTVGVDQDLNFQPQLECGRRGLSVLKDYDEWASLLLGVRSVPFRCPFEEENTLRTAAELSAMRDSDGDGVSDVADNCPVLANPEQADANTNGIGDLCECGDMTGDRVINADDVLSARFALLGDRTFSGEELARCDTDGSGGCDLRDAVAIARSAGRRAVQRDTSCVGRSAP